MAQYQGIWPNHGRKSKKTGGTMPAGKHNYVVPTLNHGDVLFTSGITKDAVEFKDPVPDARPARLDSVGMKARSGAQKGDDGPQGARVR